ncbi:MAG: peptidylprolyl isomerase [Acidobacteria bacterium]|nr:peptidylprolyl isomerase [Acidobacteriota bacterium]
MTIVREKEALGEIKLQLFEKESPVTVKNFVDLALGKKAYLHPLNGLPSLKPFYEGLLFHRVIPKFMIQGGDPHGTGHGATESIPDELENGLKFDRPGRLGMANAGPNTGSCQFFITEVDTPHLNGLHTVFGQVVSGQELVARVARFEAISDKPTVDIRMTKITIERIGAGPDPNQLQ